jgi:hypothetical protein
MSREFITDKIKNTVLKKLGNRMDVNEDFLNNLDYNIKATAGIESDFNLQAQNEVSTASGMFQFTNDGATTAANRLLRIVDEPWIREVQSGKTNVSSLNQEQQTMLYLGDITEKKGTDVLLQSIGEGDLDSYKELYARYHHTDPDKATLDRMEDFFKDDLIPFKKKIEPNAELSNFITEGSKNLEETVLKSFMDFGDVSNRAKENNTSILSELVKDFALDDELTEEESILEAENFYKVKMDLNKNKAI